MSLEKTKIVLERLRTKYIPEIKYARQDVKPTYTKGPNKSGNGYSYDPLDHNDTDTVYNALGELQSIFNDTTGPIHFDLAHYIVEKKAGEDLEFTIAFLEGRKTTLIEIKERYAAIKPHIYPVEVVLNYYVEILNVLNGEILNSDEFKALMEPGLIKSLEHKNEDLLFEIHWNKRRWSYIVYLIAFLFFLAAGIVAILYKENENLPKWAAIGIPVFLGIFTILFNLFFGFHNTFKDAYKIILPGTRKHLMKQEKEKFLKSNK